MSDKQHTADKERKLAHKTVSKSTEGGKCLNSHMGRSKNSCSYQWQGFHKAQKKKALYNWNKYDGIGSRKLAMRTSSGFVWVSRPTPRKGDWDVGATIYKGRVNHADHCDTPYYHEAHHIIPDSVLRNCIQELFGEMAPVLWKVRAKLLQEKYNLNHKGNMILLPLDAVVARALELPRHREFNVRSHNTYSRHVMRRVKKILKVNQQNIANCKLVKYTKTKDQLISLSKTLFDRIVAAGKAQVSSLNDMNAQRFKE